MPVSLALLKISLFPSWIGPSGQKNAEIKLHKAADENDFIHRNSLLCIIIKRYVVLLGLQDNTVVSCLGSPCAGGVKI